MLDWFQSLDKRSRHLVIVAGATVLTTGLAIGAVTAQADRQQPAFAAEPFFPGITDKLNGAARLDIVSKDGHVRVERDETGSWVLPDKGGFPARIEPLRRSMEGLRSLEKVALKTANPDWHNALDLTHPDQGGDGVLVLLSDADGVAIAELLVGKADETGRINGRSQRHARHPGADQTWLTAGVLDVETDPSAWIRADLINMPRERVREAVITPAAGQAYAISRATAETPDFTLQNIPRGQEIRSSYVVNAAVGVLSDFALDDVAPRADVPVTEDAPSVILRGFDGLILTARLTRQDDAAWVTLDASGPASEAAEASGEAENTAQSAAREEAARINRIAARFAFKIPAYKADQFAKPLSELIKNKGA